MALTVSFNLIWPEIDSQVPEKALFLRVMLLLRRLRVSVLIIAIMIII